ncbi:N-terminal C2 in EEIG1 and EHBP1 proteins domain containing protein [Naviculisporaceae sp. PSN 640]
MQFLSLVSKARKPKFDLHLTIYDLNNVPLVSGVSLIKWHLPHSIHGEHRGRTQKCPIANHRVEYNYSKLVPLRIAIDRNNNLAECWIEFEVLQEFSVGSSTNGPNGREEKITLGTLRINLAEYVEESEALLRETSINPALHRMSFTPNGGRESGEKYGAGHYRRRSSMSGSTGLSALEGSPRSSQRSVNDEDRSQSEVQEGVIRRYLMEDSKINSTLKIGILMVQVDGERNYVAPPLKTAAVFGGIAGIVAADGLDQTDPHADAAGQMPLLSHKSRELFELQDAYRRVLTASWTSQPGELPADQCIEDIFAGGDGFRSEHKPRNANRSPSRPPVDPSSSSTHGSINTSGGSSGIPMRTPSTGSSGGPVPREDSGSTSGGEDLSDMMSTLRPRDRSRLQFHLRNMSTTTVMGGSGSRDPDRDRDRDRESSRAIGVDRHPHHRELLAPLQMSASSAHHSHGGNHYGHHHHRRDGSKERFDSGGHGGGGREGGGVGGGVRSRSESLTSLATTLGSDRGRDGFKRAREVDEFEIREDLVSWAVPGVQASL